MKMGNLPRSFALRLWKKLKHTVPARKLLGLECCMPNRAEVERVSALVFLVYTVAHEGRDCQCGASGAAVQESGGDHQAPPRAKPPCLSWKNIGASVPPEQGAPPRMWEGGWVWLADPFSSHRRRPDGVRGNRAHRS